MSLVINNAKKKRKAFAIGSIILAINQGLPYLRNAPSLVKIQRQDSTSIFIDKLGSA